MIKRIAKFVLAPALAGFFFWLAFRHVHLHQLWNYAKTIRFWWLAPFTIVMFLSNFIRAERWGLLIEHEKRDLDHVTLTAGVFNGYFFNLVGPRFGEISRPVYVARRENISPSKLIGTIVLERIIDLISLVILLVITILYLISNLSLLRRIFGNKTVDIITGHIPLFSIVWIVIAVIGAALIGYGVFRAAKFLAARFERVNYWLQKLKEALINFKEGLLAVRKVERWGLFILYTALIWFCYILMAFIPFWMFNMQHVYGLGLLQAVVVTVVSSIGMAIPSPGGLGTYEYFVEKTLLVLFGVPAVTGLAYAVITQAANIFLIILFTPITFAVDKWRRAKKGAQPL